MTLSRPQSVPLPYSPTSTPPAARKFHSSPNSSKHPSLEKLEKSKLSSISSKHPSLEKLEKSKLSANSLILNDANNPLASENFDVFPESPAKSSSSSIKSLRGSATSPINIDTRNSNVGKSNIRQQNSIYKKRRSKSSDILRRDINSSSVKSINSGVSSESLRPSLYRMHSVGGLGGSIQGWSIDDVPNEVQHSPSRPRNMSIVLNRSSTVSAIQRCSSVKQQETGNRGDGLAFNTRLATKIKEERYNYTLIHHMLFCIQLSASKFTAGNARDVRVSDYHSVFKAFYDDFGIETTSKSDFDFEFKDYAPFVFKKIRDTFSVESQEYLNSLSNKYILSEFGFERQDSFSFFSNDYRFMVRIISQKEHRCIRKFLPEYYAHIRDNPSTLLPRIYGLHRIKFFFQEYYFIIVANLLPPNKDVHRLYILKGFTSKNTFDTNKISKLSRGDKEWLEQKEMILLAPSKKSALVSQLRKDLDLFSKCQLVNYSFLVGMNDVLKPSTEFSRGSYLLMMSTKIDEQVRRSVVAEPVPFGPDTKVIFRNSFVQGKSLFHADMGGFLSKDSKLIYYFGFSSRFEENSKLKGTISAPKFAERLMQAVELSLLDSE